MTTMPQNNALTGRRLWTCLAATVLCLATAQPALAGAREQAKRIHDRLAGTHPSETVLDQMEASINAGNPQEAADLAMENSAFYNVTLKNMVTPWTNEAQTVFAPLNDYTATVIGIVRDEDDFRKILFDDVLYTADNSVGAPAYQNNNNAHYEYLENNNINLKDLLVRRAQSSVNGLPPEATAGVLTSRAAAKAFFIAGTNRAMFRFTLINHMCGDLEAFKDETRIPDRIRQDVSRSPGGDSRIFLNSCIACHSGMDPLVQAFAYYDYEFNAETDPEGENGELVYNTAGMTDPDTGTRVKAKYHINNNTFKYGYVTQDDQWSNYWRKGQNANLGWDPALTGEGQGAKSMGQELAYSARFAQCQVRKVFKTVCLREPGNAADRSQIETMVTNFANSNYNLKQTFGESAVYCMGN
ncbi:hypothetical protein [Pleionea litopenaei]|uniref:DUF1585 domain-containing protein n=1 Tax=Pleionea litopenaei TaxID=3070815 RepID=A0AA51X826_9GAMM|nr:hypothetical protein [Pleionea sp. HL-JVS1]WMS88509.1 hypothetical protein Q9312_06225 [Pleionea sp. HL-JVS1]